MRKTNYEDSSFIGGVAGAFTGAAIGSIPWGILAYMGWYIGYLSFLIGISSFFGYKYLRGPKNRTTAYACVIISAVFVVLAMNIVTIMCMLYMQGYYVSFDTVKIIFLLGGAELYKDMGISLLITLVGLSGIKQRIVAYVDGTDMQAIALENAGQQNLEMVDCVKAPEKSS